MNKIFALCCRPSNSLTPETSSATPPPVHQTCPEPLLAGDRQPHLQDPTRAPTSTPTLGPSRPTPWTRSCLPREGPCPHRRPQPTTRPVTQPSCQIQESCKFKNWRSSFAFHQNDQKEPARKLFISFWLGWRMMIVQIDASICIWPERTSLSGLFQISMVNWPAWFHRDFFRLNFFT